MEEHQNEPEEQGTVDAVSVLYVLGGIPLMIVFFVGMFLLVGSCDSASSYISSEFAPRSRRENEGVVPLQRGFATRSAARRRRVATGMGFSASC
jgi:hypothetical protein